MCICSGSSASASAHACSSSCSSFRSAVCSSTCAASRRKSAQSISPAGPTRSHRYPSESQLQLRLYKTRIASHSKPEVLALMCTLLVITLHSYASLTFSAFTYSCSRISYLWACTQAHMNTCREQYMYRNRIARVQGMEYLEQRGIVHRDLAARNVLGSLAAACDVHTRTHTRVQLFSSFTLLVFQCSVQLSCLIFMVTCTVQCTLHCTIFCCLDCALVQMPMHVRISDFGLAKVLDNSSEYEASGGKACSNALAHHQSVAPTFQICISNRIADGHQVAGARVHRAQDLHSQKRCLGLRYAHFRCTTFSC